MNGGDWTWLEVAKLMVGAATPLLVLFLGIGVTRLTRRLEQAQWATRKAIERRIALYDQMVGPLNDLFCFFRLVGDFQNITPPHAVERKRRLDKLFFTHETLMSKEFADHYQGFISACFRPYAAHGRDAQLKASIERHRAERDERWNDEWERYFVDTPAAVTGLAEITLRYRALMRCFAEQIGVPQEEAPKRGARAARASSPAGAA